MIYSISHRQTKLTVHYTETNYEKIAYRVGTVWPPSEILHLLDQLVGKSLCDYREPVDIRARVLQNGVFLQALAVVRVKVALFPIEPIVLNFPQLVVKVLGAKFLRGYQVTPVTAVGDVKEVPVVSHILAEGHVGVKLMAKF